MTNKFIHTFVSVDCVIFGFDNHQLNVLLVQLNNDKIGDKELKLPGSLIYDHEDVDDAAQRILYETTGIKRIRQHQFKCFADPNRASHTDVVKWVNHTYQPGIDRLITVAYISLCKIDRKINHASKYKSVMWCPISKLPVMPFDHNQIVNESLMEIYRWIQHDQIAAFELLPQKFTMMQLHALYESVYNVKIDLRNFYKKVRAMNYVLPLDEKQENVAHRAAQFYKFDKRAYNKLKI